MLCLISFIFLLSVVGSLEADTITFGQAIWYGAYGLLMFYHTSKKYWDYEEYQKTKKRVNHSSTKEND